MSVRSCEDYGMFAGMVTGIIDHLSHQTVRDEKLRAKMQQTAGDQDRKSRFPVVPIQNVLRWITVGETTVYLIVQIEEDIERIDILLTKLFLQSIVSYSNSSLPYTSYFSRLILTSSSVSERGAPSMISRI